MRISESRLRRLIRSVLSEVTSRTRTSVYEFLKSEGVDLNVKPSTDIEKFNSVLRKFNSVLRKYNKCIPDIKINLALQAFQIGDRDAVESALSPHIDKCVRQDFDDAEAGMDSAFGNKPHNIIFPDDGIERKQTVSPDIFDLDAL
jgi:hypothetical protein